MAGIPHLMLITARARNRRGLPELAELAIAGGVDVIQLREPELSHVERRTVALAILDRIGSPDRLIVNNDLKLAAELGCGLHLPEQSDQLAAARTRLGRSAIIGRSVHTSANASDSADADYLIAGHVFATSSKPGQPPLGLAGLAAIVAAALVPVLAVGGITAERIPGVMATGASGVAVIGAIAEASDPQNAAACLRQQLIHSLEEKLLVSASESIASTITLIVNGKSLAVPTGSSIADLLRQRQLEQRLVAVEHNRTIIPQGKYESTLLATGDEVEIVHFVGGG